MSALKRINWRVFANVGIVVGVGYLIYAIMYITATVIGVNEISAFNIKFDLVWTVLGSVWLILPAIAWEDYNENKAKFHLVNKWWKILPSGLGKISGVLLMVVGFYFFQEGVGLVRQFVFDGLEYQSSLEILYTLLAFGLWGSAYFIFCNMFVWSHFRPRVNTMAEYNGSLVYPSDKGFYLNFLIKDEIPVVEKTYELPSWKMAVGFLDVGYRNILVEVLVDFDFDEAFRLNIRKPGIETIEELIQTEVMEYILALPKRNLGIMLLWPSYILPQKTFFDFPATVKFKISLPQESKKW